MASSNLTIEHIYNYFKENGNVVVNRDIVHHFRGYLTDPATKADARAKFKKFVNILAHSKVEGDCKYLYLKTKYLHSLDSLSINEQTNVTTSHYDSRLSLGIPISPARTLHDYNTHETTSNSPIPRQPPPYRPPPPVTSPSNSLDNISLNSFNSIMSNQDLTPQPPPRKKSSDKLKNWSSEPSTPVTPDRVEVDGTEKQSISVKERTQKFNRLASIEDELSPRHKSAEKPKVDNKGVDEDDGASVTSLEPKKCIEWCVTASKNDLQELVKLAKDEPRLVNRKNVLHWGAKHGNAEIIKVFAGRYKVDVDARTNGGYTPLHLAAQFGHKDIFKLLIEVYKADPKIRDYSGHLPEYYLIAREKQNMKKDKTRSEYNGSVKHGKLSSHLSNSFRFKAKPVNEIKLQKKQSDKDLGFLRIGSLNVRVKKTTEAFSNFLGVGGGGSINPIDNNNEKILKGWGSADNLNQENSGHKGNFVKKKAKRLQDSGIVISTPSTPRQMLRNSSKMNSHDSDSDSAAGFDSQWKN